MKILFLSNWGASVPLAMACADQGHDIKFWIDPKEKDSQDVGDGFVPKIKEYKENVPWADLIICDNTRYGEKLDEIRKSGKAVVGGTALTDALEDDRGLGQKLFKSVGFDLLDSQEFKSIEDAVAYVDENPKRYVVKVSGAAQDDKTTTYVGQMEDGSDILPVLERMGKKLTKGVSGVEVQEHVDGLEVGISGFFNGNKFIGPCQVNFEHKKLMSWNKQSGIGPNTGEMGTTAFWMDKKIGLFQKVLLPMIGPLSKMGYHGDFDINCIIQDGKIYPLEMTNRFGWPTLPLQIETLKENDFGEMFMAMATGEDMDIIVTNTASLCVVVGVPPLPYDNADIFEGFSKGMPVLFKDGTPPEGIYPGEAKYEGGTWQVAGATGCLAVCAAGGETIEECRDMAYDLADQVVVPNKMVRDDIGRTTEDSMYELEEMDLVSQEEYV